MAFQSVPNTAEAVINYVINGQPAINRINFESPGGYTQTEIDALAAVIDLAVDAYIMPLVMPAVNYLFTKVRGLESAIDLEATNATSSGTGAASGTQQAQQQSYVVKLGTGATGRSARGRFYMPPTGSANLNSPRAVSSGYSNNCVDALADLLADAALAGWTGVITSRYTGGAARPTGVNRVITDIIASNLNIDTQRRRVGK